MTLMYLARECALKTHIFDHINRYFPLEQICILIIAGSRWEESQAVRHRWERDHRIHLEAAVKHYDSITILSDLVKVNTVLSMVLIAFIQTKRKKK